MTYEGTLKQIVLGMKKQEISLASKRLQIVDATTLYFHVIRIERNA